jgi:hypothetical protein
LWALLAFLRGERDPLLLLVFPALSAGVVWLLAVHNHNLRENRKQRLGAYRFEPPESPLEKLKKLPSARFERVREYSSVGLLVLGMAAVPLTLVPSLDAAYPVGVYLPTAGWTTDRRAEEWNFTLTRAVLTLEELQLTVLAENRKSRPARLGVARKLSLQGMRTRITQNDEPGFPLTFPKYLWAVDGLTADSTVSIGPLEERSMVLRFPRPDHLAKDPWHLDLVLLHDGHADGPMTGASCGFDFHFRSRPSEPLPQD